MATAITTQPVERENYLNKHYGVGSWLFTTDHKRIALLYLVSITFFINHAVCGGPAEFSFLLNDVEVGTSAATPWGLWLGTAVANSLSGRSKVSK